MADYKVSIDVDVNSSELDKLEAKVSRIKLETPEVGVKVNTEDFKKINKIIKEVDNKGVTVKATVEGVNKLGELQTQIYSLNKKGETEIKTRVVTEGVDKAKTDIQQISESYKKMTSEINKIASMKAELVGLDKSSKRAKNLTNDIAESTDKVKALKSEIKSLNDGSMPIDMANGYKEAWAGVSKSIRDAKASISDKSDANKIKDDYKEVLNITREIGKKETALVGLKESSEDAKYLTQRLKELKAAKDAINTSKFTDAQNKAIEKLESKNSNNLAQAQAKFYDKSLAQDQKNSANEVESKYKELLNITREIGKTKIQLLGLDEASEEAQVLNQRLKELEDRKAELASTRYNLFNDSQEKSISSAEKDNAYALEKAESKLSDLKTKAAKDIVVKFDVQGNLDAQMSTVDTKLASLGEFADRASSEYDELTVSAEKFKAALSSGNESEIIATSAQFNSSLDKMKSKLTEVANEKKKFDAEMKSVSGALGAAETSGDVTHNIESQMNAFVNKSKEAVSAVKELKTAQQELNTAANNYKLDPNAQNKAALIASEEKFTNAVKESNVQLEKQSLEIKKQQAALKLQKWGKEHDAIGQNETHAKEFQSYIQAIKSADTKAALDSVTQQTSVWTQSMELAGEAGQTMGTKIKNSFSRLTSYFSAASVILAGIQLGKQAFQNVLDIDTQMTELKRVTDLSAMQYTNIYDKLSASAQKYGVQLTDLISATADWSRAGFDADTASGLAEITSVYQHISDLDYDTASENLLTAYKGFQSELTSVYGDSQQGVLDAVNHISDVYNEIDNNYATTAADVGEAIKRSASALSVAGNSLEETAGMVTGITEVTQDPEKAGNALKVISMRIRGMSGELQDLGEEVDDNVTNISKMQGDILNLTHGKVNIFDDAGNFKSTYEVLQGIAGVWKELSSTDQADLLETMAGKHRANDLAAILNNWERVEAATKSASNSTGSAMEEQEKYADSLQGRLNSLQATWQQLSNTFISSGLAKGAVTIFKDLLAVIDKIISTMGGFGTVGLAGVLFAGFKKRSGVSNLISSFFGDLNAGLELGISKFQAFGEAGKSAGAKLKSFFKTPTGAITKLGLAIAAVSAVIQFAEDKIAEANKARQEKFDASNNFNDSFDSFEQAYIKYSDKTILSSDEENELTSATNGTIDALGNKSAALRDVAGASSDYVSNLNDIAKAELKQQNQLATDAQKAAKDKIKDSFSEGITRGLADVFNGVGKYDFLLPSKNSKEWDAIKDITTSKSFAKHVENRSSGRTFGKELDDDFSKKFNFDADSGLDGYIEQLNYVNGIVDRLKAKATETGDDSYLDSVVYEQASKAVEGLSTDLGEYIKQTYSVEKASYQLKNGIPKTTGEFYKMQEAVLKASSSTVAGRQEILDLLNKDYADTFDLSSVESQIEQFQALTNGIKSISKDKENKFEALIDLKTKVNNGECSVGDYSKAVDEANDAINEIAKKDYNTANAIRVQLGIEVDSKGNVDDEVVKLKNKFVKALTKNKVEKEVAESFTNKLSKTELEAAVELSATGEIDLKNIDTKNLDASIKQKIQDYAKYLEATRFTLNIETETEDLSNLNTALSESRAATGLTQESIENIEKRYKSLDGYNPAAIFEKTTTGVRLNTKALQSLEEQYVATNKAANDQKLGALAKRYKEIEALREKEKSGSDKYKDYSRQLEDLNSEIEAAKMAAAAYDGLTSSYNEWLNAKSNGQAGDMYDEILNGAESAKELAKAGKWGNTELQNFIKMFSAPDSLDNATPEQYAAGWGSAISKANRYFKEGTAGIDDFLSVVAAADSRLVKMNDQGVWEIQPGFDTKDWGKAAGMAESTIEAMFGEMEEYGFDVPIGIEEESIDDLVAKADSASNALKSSMGQDFDIKVNTDVSSTKEASSEIENLKKQRDDINNSSATVEVKEQGVEAVNSAIEAVINKQIELEQPTYMQLDTSQVKSTMTDALTALQNYQNAVDNVKSLEMQQDAGIEIDTSQLDDAKKKVDETAEAIAKLDGKQKVAIGLEASDSVEDVKKKIENGKVKLTVDTDVNKSATQELASNLEKIKDKDVTVTVKVKGLDDVKTLNKQINIAAKVDGTVKDLTAFADAAKKLKDVDDDTVKTVTASLYGNLSQNDNLDSLQQFIDGAKDLEDVDSSFVTVNATFDGNLKEKSGDIENMEKFAKGAKALQDAPSSSVTVEANLKGEGVGNNIFGDNSTLDNIKKFADGAKTLQGIGDAKVTIEANLKGEGVGDNIFGDNSKLDNIKKFAEGAKALQGVGDASVNITANLEGKGIGNNIFGDNSTLDNLEKFAKAAERLKDVADANVSVTANLNGSGVGNNIFGDNSTLDNLDKFADAAERLNGVQDVKVNVEANLSGNGVGNNIFGDNSTLDNLKKFADGAKRLKDVDNVSASVDVNLDGNIGNDIFGSNSKLDNLEKFAEGAKSIKDVGTVKADVEVNLSGDGIGNDFFGNNSTLDNLEKFAKGAEKLKGIGNISTNVSASLDSSGVGNDIFGSNSAIDNLDKFADGAKKLSGLDDVDVSITANLKGDGVGNNIFGDNSTLDNLEKFAKAAKKLEGVGDVDANVNVGLKGDGVGNDVFGSNSTIDNLEKFADGAKKLQGVGDASVDIEANLKGDIDDSTVDNLSKFAKGAKSLQDVEDVSVNVTANLESTGVSNNVFGDNSALDNINRFARAAERLKGVEDVKVNVSASLDSSGVGNDIFGNNSVLDNMSKFAKGANALKDVGNVKASVTASLSGDGIGNDIFGNNSTIDNLKKFAAGAKSLADVGSVSVKVSANLDGNIGNGVLGGNSTLDNLGAFAKGAKQLKGVEDKSVTISAYLEGNLGLSSDVINNLPSFVSTAKALQSVEDKSVTVSAYVGGDITSDKVSTLSKFGSVISSLPPSKTVTVNTNVDTGAIANVKSTLQGLSDSGLMHNYTATITVNTNVDTSAVDNYSPADKTGKVTYEVDASKVNSWSAPPKTGTVTYNPSVTALTDGQLHKTGTITYKATVEGAPVVNGTAHANGTAGHAFKNGDWSTKDSGTALMGELGQELIVRDGRFFTVGDNGAEFVPYKKGDIIFNHKQTEELFKNGYVTSGGGRGVAMASGTAFANVGHGTWKPGGIGGGYSGGGSSSSGSRSLSNSGSNSNSNSNANKEAEKTEETLDWIETALDRVERAISRLDKTATSTYKNWTKRGTALNDQISQTRREIDLQNQAYNRYIQQANSVGLDAGYAAKVRDGTIDIEKITDEDLNNKISEYKQWYEKALDCLDAIDDLRESESKLYEQRFENVSTKYDGYLGVIQHEKDMLDEFVSQTETAGYITSGKYYDAMSANAKKQQEELKKQRDEMISELNNAVNSGTIEKYSESWYSMVNSVDEVTKSIEECNTSLLEYEKNLRELDWQIFDLIQDKISKVADESEFLINLMSNKKLYEDNGQLTDEGMATMGQYGVKYNVYMAQADKYAKKIKELQADLAKDPYNQDIANQLQEYIEAQQEAILNAEDMKNSIKDMVSDGIDKELDSLQKLIDKRNDALDAAKDLYDYQKKIKESTKDIADLEKQMAAYQGDVSEETKAKIQQIKVDLEEAKSDLEETEYEQYISDQQKMLDDLYNDYETILNQRLDDIDALMADMISEINNNASTIGATIESQADKVGYTLSESMNTIWLSGNGSISSVITMYGTKFDTALTTTNTALGYINTNIQNMITQLNKLAGTKIKAAGASSAATEKPTQKPSSTPAQQQQQQQQQKKQVTVGGTINAGSARIYADSYGNGGGRQTFGNDPIYTVLQERNGYILTRWHKLSSGYTGWFKKSDVSAYALGAKNIRNNEMAWTQENGSEMIMRPSDGAILTPLAKNDSVLTSAASSNIWNMANNPSNFIKDNLDLDKIDTGANVGNKTTYTQNLDKVVFNLPNVKNYDELLKSMQHDKNFERLIMSMTIDPIAGKSSLAKGKAIR